MRKTAGSGVRDAVRQLERTFAEEEDRMDWSERKVLREVVRILRLMVG